MILSSGRFSILFCMFIKLHLLILSFKDVKKLCAVCVISTSFGSYFLKSKIKDEIYRFSFFDLLKLLKFLFFFKCV